MTDIDLVLTLADRVKRLREQLQEAERDLEGAVRGKLRSPVHAKKQSAGQRRRGIGVSAIGQTLLPPVTQRVAKYLVGHGPSEFGAILAAVQPATRFAVKSALVQARKKGEVEFANNVYAVKTKKPSRGRPRKANSSSE